jgi:hypothetical protein
VTIISLLQLFSVQYVYFLLIVFLIVCALYSLCVVRPLLFVSSVCCVLFVLFCVERVICMSCIVGQLPPGKTPFAVKINNKTVTIMNFRTKPRDNIHTAFRFPHNSLTQF